MGRLSPSFLAAYCPSTCVGWAAVPTAWITWSFFFCCARSFFAADVGVISGTLARRT